MGEASHFIFSYIAGPLANGWLEFSKCARICSGTTSAALWQWRRAAVCCFRCLTLKLSECRLLHVYKLQFFLHLYLLFYYYIFCMSCHLDHAMNGDITSASRWHWRNAVLNFFLQMQRNSRARSWHNVYYEVQQTSVVLVCSVTISMWSFNSPWLATFVIAGSTRQPITPQYLVADKTEQLHLQLLYFSCN